MAVGTSRGKMIGEIFDKPVMLVELQPLIISKTNIIIHIITHQFIIILMENNLIKFEIAASIIIA